jgi:hypothetical protein
VAEPFRPINWVFYGRVLPDVPTISIPLPRHTANVALGFSFELEGEIHNSKLMAGVRQLSPVDILTLKNVVKSDIQSSVDLAGFLVGAGLDVDLVSARADNGSWHYFDAFIPALQITGEVQLAASLIIATSADVPAHIMLADFREAIRTPLQTGFFSYRAIEAAMQSFKTDPRGSDKDAWSTMREELNIDRAAIDRVKAHADWARHGQSGSITDGDRLVVLKSTRAIIQRYLDYIVGGRVTLDGSTYPRLT